MSIKDKAPKKNGGGRSSRVQKSAVARTQPDTIPLEESRAFPIARRGVVTSSNLSSLHTAILADVYAGVDLKVVDRALKVTGQIMTHEAMKIRAGVKRNSFLLGK